MQRETVIFLSAMGLAITGCASTGQSSDEQQIQTLEQDRSAIRAMTGDYRVHFNFFESLPLLADYELRDDQQSSGLERVKVIVDEPDRIVLQHILMVGEDHDRPLKHWRQEWIYQPEAIFEYAGNGQWERETLSPEAVRGQWLQSVTQVDDSPRYESLGHWEHHANFSEWTGHRTWRPLPRREHTSRDDYDVLGAVNRHTVTETGWWHEQDNRKIELTSDSDRVLVREIGLNEYRVVDSDAAAFEQAADYWQENQAFWDSVVAAWDSLKQECEQIRVTPDDNGPIWRSMFDLESRWQSGEIDNTSAAIRETLGERLETEPAACRNAAWGE
ncbi:hypothetical protein J2T60_001584 [Natronospira proteinivora]|uniref:Uncharacterized protein n=1 Tax=Natronospira proteinivora TaxID=1807133 RepID=A0ABT1G8G1_9GAMM|nr:DUF6607 family protein [Natronospira proteinivora]MCP1727584.1 hypothetical protein [Natronospira proteinivora]